MDLVGKKVCLIACNMPGVSHKATILKTVITVDSITRFCEEWNIELKKADVWEQIFSKQSREIMVSMFSEKNVRQLGHLNIPCYSLADALNNPVLRLDMNPNQVLIFDFKTNDILWYNMLTDDYNQRLTMLGR